MAGDGGRVPDVSEQRAKDHAPGIEAAADALHRRLRADWSEASCERMAAQAVVAYLSRADPASVLAALLAESPAATVSAIEALLTSDEAIEAAADALATRLVDPAFGPTHFQLKMRERDRAQTATAAACRSLLSKAPKEGGDA